MSCESERYINYYYTTGRKYLLSILDNIPAKAFQIIFEQKTHGGKKRFLGEGRIPIGFAFEKGVTFENPRDLTKAILTTFEEMLEGNRICIANREYKYGTTFDDETSVECMYHIPYKTRKTRKYEEIIVSFYFYFSYEESGNKFSGQVLTNG